MSRDHPGSERWNGQVKISNRASWQIGGMRNLMSVLYRNWLCIFQKCRTEPRNIHLVLTKVSAKSCYVKRTSLLIFKKERDSFVHADLSWDEINTESLFGLWILSFSNKNSPFLHKWAVLLCVCLGWWVMEGHVNTTEPLLVSGWNEGHRWARRTLQCNLYFQREMLAKGRRWSQSWPLRLEPAVVLAPLFRQREEPRSEVIFSFPHHYSARLACLALKNSSIKRNRRTVSDPKMHSPL